MTSYHTREQDERNTLPPSDEALELSVRVVLTAELLEKVRAIDDYDLWFVAERLRDEGFSDEQAGSLITEFKKYMTLFALGYEDLGMISREVDEVWHSFILFTEEYTEFCRSIFSRYIHHAPNTSRSPLLSSACVVNFNDAYTRVFGPLPDIWESKPLKSTLAYGESAVADCNSSPRDPGNKEVAGYSAAGDCNGGGAPQCRGVSGR